MNHDLILQNLEEYQEDLDLVLNENARLVEEIQALQDKNDELKRKLALYESPHLPSSKQLIEKKKRKFSGLPQKPKGKRGGSKKGKSSIQKSKPDRTIDNFVQNCLGFGIIAPTIEQSKSYGKQIYEIPAPVKIEYQEHIIYKFECKCGTITEAGNPTLKGTSLGPNLLAFITSTRNRTGASFENISKLLIDLSESILSQTVLNRGLSKVANILEPERFLKSIIIHRKRGQAFRSEQAMEEFGILLTVLNTWKERGLNIIQELHSQI